MSQGGDCWEIASNSNCDLESQLGFLLKNEKLIRISFVWKEGLFLGEEGKSIPLCEWKDYSLVWKESLFLVKEVMYS